MTNDKKPRITDVIKKEYVEPSITPFDNHQTVSTEQCKAVLVYDYYNISFYY